jgi:hypothetical protein
MGRQRHARTPPPFLAPHNRTCQLDEHLQVLGALAVPVLHVQHALNRGAAGQLGLVRRRKRLRGRHIRRQLLLRLQHRQRDAAALAAVAAGAAAATPLAAAVLRLLLPRAALACCCCAAGALAGEAEGVQARGQIPVLAVRRLRLLTPPCATASARSVWRVRPKRVAVNLHAVSAAACSACVLLPPLVTILIAVVNVAHRAALRARSARWLLPATLLLLLLLPAGTPAPPLLPVPAAAVTVRVLLAVLAAACAFALVILSAPILLHRILLAC